VVGQVKTLVSATEWEEEESPGRPEKPFEEERLAPG
jgi:hypothetical protein